MRGSIVTRLRRMVTSDEDADGELRTHVEDLPDGCGCVEIWEHRSRNQVERDRAND